jgi:hypothetical protein
MFTPQQIKKATTFKGYLYSRNVIEFVTGQDTDILRREYKTDNWKEPFSYIDIEEFLERRDLYNLANEEFNKRIKQVHEDFYKEYDIKEDIKEDIKDVELNISDESWEKIFTKKIHKEIPETVGKTYGEIEVLFNTHNRTYRCPPLIEYVEKNIIPIIKAIQDEEDEKKRLIRNQKARERRIAKKAKLSE